MIAHNESRLILGLRPSERAGTRGPRPAGQLSLLGHPLHGKSGTLSDAGSESNCAIELLGSKSLGSPFFHSAPLTPIVYRLAPSTYMNRPSPSSKSIFPGPEMFGFHV